MLATILAAKLLNFSIKDAVHVLETVMHFESASTPNSIDLFSMRNIISLFLMSVYVIYISVRHF